MKNIEVITLSKKSITDFARERNVLLSKAKKNWVLFLDSDETLSNQEFPVSYQFSGYRIKRKNYFLGKYVGTEYLVRLGKRTKGSWQRAVHEEWRMSGKIGLIDKPFIIHNTAENLHSYIEKINFYSTLHAKANKKEGKHSNLFKIIFYPPVKFTVTLIRSRHFVFSLMQALHSFMAWSKLYFLRS